MANNAAVDLFFLLIGVDGGAIGCTGAIGIVAGWVPIEDSSSVGLFL